MTLNIQAKINGVAQLSQPISLKVAGPYQSNGKGKLPSFNWQVSVSGGGQAFSGGLISTGHNAFVNFQGTNYEVGADKIAQVNQQLGQQTGSGKTLKDFGIDPQAWVKDPQDKGDENVNGVDTTHVQATVDVARMFTDFNKTIQQAGGAMGTSDAAAAHAGPDPEDLADRQGPEVRYLRRQERQQDPAAVGVDRLPDPGRPARPVPGRRRRHAELLDRLREGRPDADDHRSGERAADLRAPAAARWDRRRPGRPWAVGRLERQAVARAGGSGSSGSNPTPAQFQKYSKCLEQADPSNTGAIQRCAQLLK